MALFDRISKEADKKGERREQGMTCIKFTTGVKPGTLQLACAVII